MGPEDSLTIEYRQVFIINTIDKTIIAKQHEIGASYIERLLHPAK